MSQCVECKTRMGFTESNVAREHKGLCLMPTTPKQHQRLNIQEQLLAMISLHSPLNIF